MSTSKSLEDIKKLIRKHKEELKEKYGVKDIGIFGSYVRGEQKERSDVDILIDFYPNTEMDLIKFVELEYYLSDLIGVKVDLVTKKALKPRIGMHVLKEVIYV